MWRKDFPLESFVTGQCTVYATLQHSSLRMRQTCRTTRRFVRSQICYALHHARRQGSKLNATTSKVLRWSPGEVRHRKSLRNSERLSRAGREVGRKITRSRSTQHKRVSSQRNTAPLRMSDLLSKLRLQSSPSPITHNTSAKPLRSLLRQGVCVCVACFVVSLEVSGGSLRTRSIRVRMRQLGNDDDVAVYRLVFPAFDQASKSPTPTLSTHREFS